MTNNNFEIVMNKYNKYVVENYIYEFIKVENIIKNDRLYITLDMDEQEVIMDMIQAKVQNLELKNINEENNNKLISKTKNINEENKYVFGKKNSSVELSSNSYAGLSSNSYTGLSSNSSVGLSSNSSYGFTPSYPSFGFKRNTNNVINFSDIPALPPIISISNSVYNQRKEIYDFLKAIELPEQRSEAWFKMREGMATASDAGAIVGENKHEEPYKVVMKKVFGSTFVTNIDCYHGKKFENVVTIMYEYNYDTIVEEFGLLGHPDIYFLGASPDGICGPYKRDGVSKCDLVGRMLEIKCPSRRKIKYSGEVKGEICPIYYWCQVQQQLECCNLPECDFVQVNIEEYQSRQDFLDDTTENKEFISKKTGFEKGCLIELLPAKLADEDYNGQEIKDTVKYDKATFLYQPKIDMTNYEINKWILDEIDKLSKKPNLRLNKIIYWRILERNCTLILRDTEWFKNNLPQMRKIWSYVEFLRINTSVAEEWKLFIDSLNKKYNDKILEKLDNLIFQFKNKNNTLENNTLENNNLENKKKKTNKKKINEVINNKVINNEVINNEVINNEVITNEIKNNEIINNEIITNEIINNEVITNEIKTNEVISNEIDTNIKTTKKKVNKKEIDKNEIDKKEKEINKKEINKKEIDKKEINKKEIDKKDINKKEIDKKEIDKKDIDKKEIDKKEIDKKEIDKNTIGLLDDSDEDLLLIKIDTSSINKKK